MFGHNPNYITIYKIMAYKCRCPFWLKLLYLKACLSVLCWVPASLLARGAVHNDVVHVGRIRLDGKVIRAQVTFHPELVDRRRVVHTNLKLL